MTFLPVLLPSDYSPVVSEGSSITVGQVLAQKTKDEQIINIPKHLSIPLTKVKQVLKKIPGDSVKIGEIIAIKKGFLGLDKAVIKSRVAGKVIRYERDTGNLVIQTAFAAIAEDIISPVDGTVTLCDNEKIVIQTDKNVALGKRGSGTKREGEVFILEESFLPEKREVFYHLDSRAIGKIVVAGDLSLEVMTKGISIGVIGLIGTTIVDADMEHIAQKDSNIPILVVDSDTIEKLFHSSGKQISLDGKAKSIIFLEL